MYISGVAMIWCGGGGGKKLHENCQIAVYKKMQNNTVNKYVWKGNRKNLLSDFGQL